MKPKVIVIAGATASGKTAVSIEVAKKLNGEIISADSMQIYKYMNIGTAKPTEEEKEGIKHYLLMGKWMQTIRLLIRMLLCPVRCELL